MSPLPSVLTLAIGLTLGLVAPAAADPVEASRARIQPASLTLQEPRLCWARYSAHGGAVRDGTLEEVAFRVPCPEQITPRFISSLQRALAVRGYFTGEVTGQIGPATREAVQSFQRDHGFNSPILSLDTAQRLGLAPIEITRN